MSAGLVRQALAIAAGGAARGGGAGHDPPGRRGRSGWPGWSSPAATLPIGWAVIPYPWPKGRFRATTLALIQRLQAAFPPGVRWTLVADRGFPSAALFAQLRQGERRLQRAAAAERLGDGRGRLRDGGGRTWTPGGWRSGSGRRPRIGRGRPDQPLVPGWVVGQCGGGHAAPAQAEPRHRARAGQAGQGRMPSTASTSRGGRPSRRAPPPSGMPRPGCCSPPRRRWPAGGGRVRRAG